MRILTTLGEILPISGTIGLLGLWFYQQTEIEGRSNELKQLASARNVYQMYQSHNAVFNAINECLEGKERASQQLRTFQTYNYELGLAALEEALPEAERAKIPSASYAYDSSEDIQVKMGRTQKRLEVLQKQIANREEFIRHLANSAKIKSFWWYVTLSVISVAGAVCKVVDKLSPPPSRTSVDETVA